MINLLINLPRSKATNAIAYHHAGNGTPLVLIHGVGLRAESWFPQISELAKDYSVYAVDMPGHGDSARLEDNNPELFHFADQVRVFVDEVIGESVIVVGHSLGALVALEFAHRFPTRCRGVAALTAIYQRTAQARSVVLERAVLMRSRSLQESATGPLRRWFGDQPKGHERELADLCQHWLIENDLEGYATAYAIFAAADGPSAAVLAALTMPTLFLTAGGDPNSTPAMSHAMAALAPAGEAVIIENARHLMQLTHPQETNVILCEFCQRCAQIPPSSHSTGTRES